MKFISWSGGKDCSFALYKYTQTGVSDARCLLNMVRNTPLSGHQVSESLLQAQAQRMGLDLVRERVSPNNSYLYHFDRIINILKEQGYNGGIFGDIYLEAHRNWIEKQCERLGIEPIFPLWGMPVEEIYTEFVRSGFVAKIIGVSKSYKQLLGEHLTMELYEKLLTLPDFDVCGENGEYHTFVSDSPLYTEAIPYRVSEAYENEKLLGLRLDCSV